MISSLFESHGRRKSKRPGLSPFASYSSRIPSSLHRDRETHDHQTLPPYRDVRSTGSSSGSEQGDDLAQSLQETTDGEDEEEASPLLPLFDSARLDILPIYTLTHTIRSMVSSRCETVLTWEQLRSPQVSQFLIRPIEEEIRSSHLSAATIYCLMANCLQYTKEIAIYPGNSGTIQTRAMLCELLAIKLLRQDTTRGLIDALSYDFDPLQGQVATDPPAYNHRSSWQASTRRQFPRSARISCLEIAIRAQAKRFLAHPVVVQQLEAIWDGSVVFHAATDSLHRRPTNLRQQNYGTANAVSHQAISTDTQLQVFAGTRKVVTLYNPRDASLFKLSRLRVPRYRNILSTISFAILLALFVAVLNQRSPSITPLEVVFWIWAAGYMMDELVGFSEQGYGLYIASFWNTIDLGILLIFLIHLGLRLYDVLISGPHTRRFTNMAFDLLAADAILLFPRLFSVLDHYRYFSQLIIAFRLMITDFVAVFVLIVISCSGFFVALTLSFGNDRTDNAPEVAYALLQMILGFTPAVWDRWAAYTPLGRAILVSFLFLCHFLILTILITVLTNSFTAVVKNANEEHQFIFAINTISSVKSDSLFSYVPPLNVLQWMLHPLRYILSLRQYVKINRTLIKITHFPILFSIFAYEKIILNSEVVNSIDVVERRRQARSIIAQHVSGMIQEPSIANFRQDQALEEVFKQPLTTTTQTHITNKRKANTTVNRWMRDMGEDTVGTPQEEDLNPVTRVGKRYIGKKNLSAVPRSSQHPRRPLSVASDPADLASNTGFFPPRSRRAALTTLTPSQTELGSQEETADGDDEMLTIDNDEDRMTIDTRESDIAHPLPSTDYFNHRPQPVVKNSSQTGSLRSNDRVWYESSNSDRVSPSRLIARKRPSAHGRNISSATMIFNPPAQKDNRITNGDGSQLPTAMGSRPTTSGSGSKRTSSGGTAKTHKSKQPLRSRPSFPSKDDLNSRSAPDLSGLLRPVPHKHPRRSSLELDLVSDIGDNKAIGGGYVGAIPASFVTQMSLVNGGLRKLQKERKEEQEMFGRLMMARMNSLEEGFRDVIHEMRENLKSIPGSRARSPERPAQVRRERRAADKEERERRKDALASSGRGADSPVSSSQGDLKNSQITLRTVITSKEVAKDNESNASAVKDEGQ